MQAIRSRQSTSTVSRTGKRGKNGGGFSSGEEKEEENIGGRNAETRVAIIAKIRAGIIFNAR